MPDRESTPVILCKSLAKRFGSTQAVDHLDLTVGQGDVFGFLGPNGAGKSTTMRMLVGLIQPNSGRCEIFGHDCWSQHVEAVRDVGGLIEDPAVYKYLSGRDNLRILANMGRNRTTAEIDEALDIVGMTSRAKDKVKNYSHGMKQRLAVALAIVGKPKLVLLDEPTNGLDPQGMREVRDLIRNLATEHGMTIFLSSHLLNEVEQVCNRVAVVNKGRVVETGLVSELLSATDLCRVTVGNAPQAAEVVSKMTDATVKGSADSMLTVALTGIDSAELNRRLVQAGVAVRALVPVKTSLEDIYMRIMEDGDVTTPAV